ncbi:hypothetical protein IJI86_03160 [Candidatus Saccharibacteria bacterium]|nr:hypothetical protein [Candidatus Saccharibacteria bacterium]
MKKTHKKILGSLGLGLVAAVTTAAVLMPSPEAAAIPSFTDVIQVRIENQESSFELTSGSPSVITTPGYNFRVDYDNIGDINITLVNKDDDGNIIYGPTTLWSTNVGWTAGDRTFNLDLDSYGGYGNFTITGVGEGYGSVPIERILTVRYEEPIQDIYTDEGGEGYGDVDGIPAGTEMIKTEVYDGDGNIIRTIITGTGTDGKTDVYDKDGHLVISIPGGYDPTDYETLIYMSGLPGGVYPGRIKFIDGEGSPIGRGIKVRIHWEGEEPIVVPDTGGLFQNLNISREDYLITGAVIFMVIGVVAFGIVKRNRSSKK